MRTLPARIAGWTLTAVIAFGVVCIAVGYLRADGLVEKARQARPSRLLPEHLSAEQRAILLAVEDPAFDRHHGFDLRTPGAGLTTITQGLVKFLYFERFRPGLAKIPQTLFAIGFDRAVSKTEQLELFLNHTYLGTVEGRPVHGFEEGARIYMNRPFAELTRHEFLRLVATPIAPDRLNPRRSPQGNLERVARIERLLAGNCAPGGMRDVYYQDCMGISQEPLVSN